MDFSTLVLETVWGGDVPPNATCKRGGSAGEPAAVGKAAQVLQLNETE